MEQNRAVSINTVSGHGTQDASLFFVLITSCTLQREAPTLQLFKHQTI